ncbi:MAG TPA: ATP-binding protein [Planctomycetota bacterium]|nr:ATP-binding protein [Planctomycetota bacterium]
MDTELHPPRAWPTPLGDAALRALLENLSHGVALFDGSRRCRWFNPSAAAMTDGLVEAAIDRDIVELIAERHGGEAATRFASALSACLAEGEPQRLSYWPFRELRRPDEGMTRWFDLDFARVEVEGSGQGVLLTLTEVTPHVRAQRALAESETRGRALAGTVPELERAEEALRASEHRLRWLVDNTTESIWRIELDQPIPVELDEDEQIALWIRHSRFAECNQAMAFALGFASPADVIGLRLTDLLPMDQPRNREFLRAFIRSGYRLVDHEIALTAADGRRRYLLNNLMAQVVDGYAVRSWGSCREITAYRASEAAVREGEERLRLAVSAADIGTWDYDPASGEMRWSERLAEMLVLDADERQGMDAFIGRIHAEDRARVRKLIMHAVTPGSDGAFACEFRVLTPHGVRWVAAKGRTTFAGDGSARRFLGAAIDVSERKHGEEQLARKARELERSNAELEQFAYVASHDLQEPLRMITSYLQLLQKRYSALFDDKAREYFGFAVNGAERMRAMIQAVLEYSRVGRREGAIVELDAGKALRDALDNLRAKIAASSATVVADPLPRIRADPVRLTQLFQNLVSNAIKFRKPDVAPAVRVSAAENEREWIFTIADNGIGIDREAHERIFMLFQRLHTADEYPGSGIGLATCKKIVERMGGRIWVESEAGAGATFHVAVAK